MTEPIRVMTTMTEAISADELAYHQVAAYEYRVATAVWQHWSGHLIQKYQIGPTDRLNVDGTIERGAVGAG